MIFSKKRGQKTNKIVDTIQNSKINSNLIKEIFLTNFAGKNCQNLQNMRYLIMK